MISTPFVTAPQTSGDDFDMAKSGRVLTVAQLAAEDGFTDIDGSQWPPFLIEA